jgi:large subunit ribosomal protein L16
MLLLKKIKYKKQFKNKLIGKTSKSFKIKFGKYAIKALKETRLTFNQIESIKSSIFKKIKHLGHLWIRIFPNIPITKKPIENRMGKGKGNFFCYIVKIKKGQILFEINGISFKESKKILQLISNKLPIKTKFIFKKAYSLIG